LSVQIYAVSYILPKLNGQIVFIPVQ